eukprot:81962-Pelagomonas_calceolata.AAC.1
MITEGSQVRGAAGGAYMGELSGEDNIIYPAARVFCAVVINLGDCLAVSPWSGGFLSAWR